MTDAAATGDSTGPPALDMHAYLARHERKALLRLLTCGSVDDGKSTLIGRLLHDTRMIYEDQLAALARDSKTAGTQRGGLDLALLVDGLLAEREQGITIDVAYRYFATAKRKFIIADAPGHEQYTRNMATGASNCDVAVILIDAEKGVLPQTRRHTFIAHLLGIRHLVVAVNKMDAVNYAEDVFERIRADYHAFAARLAVDDLHFIPLSALRGDNVVAQSGNMPWYQGATLMHLLESLHVAPPQAVEHFRLPVQLVNRPRPDFRGYAGTVAGGVVRPGDPVTVLPSGKNTTVARIAGADGDLAEAFAPMAVTLTLADAVDVSRGDVLAAPAGLPHVGDRLEAMLVWMGEAPLAPDRRYWVKQGTRQVVGRVGRVRYRVNVNTLAQEPADGLALNEIGRVELALSEPVVFDPYAANRALGALILIDRDSNATVAAAMALAPAAVPGAGWDQRPRGKLFATPSAVSSAEREARLGQRPATVLLTGPAKSGKTAIARAVERRLFEAGQFASVLDGQTFRLGMSRDLGFSAGDRSENIRRAAETACLLNAAGLICLAAFVAPEAAVRARARQTIGAERFLEVFLTAPLEVLRLRDDAGIYAAAERGEAHLPGMGAGFEPPATPDLVLATDALDVEACAARIVALLRERGFIPSGEPLGSTSP